VGSCPIASSASSVARWCKRSQGSTARHRLELRAAAPVSRVKREHHCEMAAAVCHRFETFQPPWRGGVSTGIVAARYGQDAPISQSSCCIKADLSGGTGGTDGRHSLECQASLCDNDRGPIVRTRIGPPHLVHRTVQAPVTDSSDASSYPDQVARGQVTVSARLANLIASSNCPSVMRTIIGDPNPSAWRSFPRRHAKTSSSASI